MTWGPYAGYEPLAQALTKEFGTEFGMWDTGGGCMVIGATLENGWEVMIGSAVDGPLIPYGEHVRVPGGFNCGVYAGDDSGTNMIGWGKDCDASSPADVAGLIRSTLAEAIKNPIRQ